MHNFFVYRFKRGGERGYGNIKYTKTECRMDKLEEMQWSVVGQEDASETGGKVYKNVVIPTMLYDADTCATTKRQDARHGVN